MKYYIPAVLIPLSSFIILAPCTASAQSGSISTNPVNYAIVGENGVSMNSYSTSLGDIYSHGDINLQFGYGIQQPSQNAGNVIATGNVNVALLSDVTGNIFANAGVNLSGDDTIVGNIVYGTGYTAGGTVSGSVSQTTNSVPSVSLPASIAFTPGTVNVTSTGSLTLAPGSYGNVTGYQSSSSSIYLSSGDYYLNSLSIPSGGSLYLNLTNGPIRVFSQGNINIGSYLTTYINGQSAGTSNLASSVLFETNGNFNFAGGGLYEFYGSVFTPSGSQSLNVEQMDGSIMSSGSVSATTYLTKQQYNWSNLPVVALTSSNATVITGGTANVGVSLTDLVISGGSAMSYAVSGSVSSGSLTLLQSLTQSGTLSAQATQNIVVPATSTNIGVNALTVTATSANSFNGSQTTTTSLTVLSHAAPALAASAANAGRVMRNTSSAIGSTSLSDSSAGYRSGLEIVSYSPGVGGLTINSVIANGSSKAISGTMSTAVTGTASSAPYTIGLSDDQSLSGATSLPSLSFTVTGTVLDNRQVTAPVSTSLGFIHVGGGVASQSLLLSTTGDDSHYTRVTVADSTTADANGMRVSGGSTSLRFGIDGMLDLRTIGGTLSSSIPVGGFSGSLSLTTGTETGVAGTQTPTNVVVNYTGQVYSGKAAWNSSTGGSWGTMPNWQDTQAGGPAGGSPGISGFAGDTATFGNSIGSSSATITLDGQSPVLASLVFGTSAGGSYNLASGTGGQITISAGTADSVITVNGGNHQVLAPLILTNTADITVTNPSDSLTINGNIGGQSPINKWGAGLLTLTGTRNPLASVTINGGTLQGNTSNVTNVTNNGALILNQPTNAPYASTMSGTGSFIKSGSARLTLAAADNLSTTGPITVQQGILTVPLGIPHNGGSIQISSGGTLEAAESIIRPVSGNGAVTAIGDVTIGQSLQTGQFNQGGAAGVGGTLNVGNNAVLILSYDAAILGSQTNLAEGGSLTTLKGAVLGGSSSLDTTKVLTATGNATINGNFTNHGLVNGPTIAGTWLNFTQTVIGAGSTTGNVEYSGNYNPGDPVTVSAQNLIFAPTSTLIMDIEGNTPGLGYDQINVSGVATLGGTLQLDLLDGYQIDPNQDYQLISGPITGQFSQVTGLPGGTHLAYSADGVSIVPEPGSLALLLAAIIVAAIRLRSASAADANAARRQAF